MNETKSSRYHRLNRRAAAGSIVCAAAVLAALLWLRLSLGILGLCLLLEIGSLPFAYYRTFVLDHRYDLSLQTFRSWLWDQARSSFFALALGGGAAYVMYRLIRWNADWWWVPLACLSTVVMLLVNRLVPVLILPLFYKVTAVTRASLVDRLISLSERAGMPVLGVYEWGLGTRTRGANAALVGAGSTRRILLSDTLLADYTDDEIEVILAHEMAHHVHNDIAYGLALETVLMFGASFAAATALRTLWQPLGLSSPSDVTGLPLLLLAGGAFTLAARPVAHAFSRRSERRADRFALHLTGHQPAFVSAMRRLALQNLTEESPSRATVVLFHTHPPVEERIGAARLPAG